MARDVRKPPVAARLALHKQGVRGWCGWCGTPVTDKTPGRGWLKWWHDKCAAEMAVIENPAAARGALLERDKGVCVDCGEDWSECSIFHPVKWRGEIRVVFARAEMRASPPWENGAHWVSTWGDPREDHYPFVELNAVSCWHADHRVPLWKVQHLPDLERLAYFMLANLVTRCHHCHERKTTEEAAERAHFARLAKAPPAKPKSKWAARPLGKRPPGAGNGFPPKGSTPMRRKKL